MQPQDLHTNTPTANTAAEVLLQKALMCAKSFERKLRYKGLSKQAPWKMFIDPGGQASTCHTIAMFNDPGQDFCCNDHMSITGSLPHTLIITTNTTTYSLKQMCREPLSRIYVRRILVKSCPKVGCTGRANRQIHISRLLAIANIVPTTNLDSDSIHSHTEKTLSGQTSWQRPAHQSIQQSNHSVRARHTRSPTQQTSCRIGQPTTSLAKEEPAC